MSATSTAIQGDTWSNSAVQRMRRMSMGSSLLSTLSPEEEDLFLEKLDTFLATLEERLDCFEKHLDDYRSVGFDQGLEKAYETLAAVRSQCSRRVGEEMSRKAKAIVDILDSSYLEAMEAKETFHEKANAGLRFLDDLLADFEIKTQASMDRQMARAKHGLEKAIDATTELADSIERAIVLAKEGKLLTYAELPNPWRVNSHILKGYRFSERTIDCIISAFHIHNETANIWTHGLGFIFVLSVGLYFYPMSNNFSISTTADKYINALFLLAAAKAMACSTVWHTMSCISELTTLERYACVDYTGISLLVASSILTTEYTAFYNEPLSRSLYMSFTIVLGIAGTIFPWRPIFNRADMRVFRVLFYVCLALSGFLPLAQLIYVRGLNWCLSFYSPILKSLIVYFAGATVYALQIPERWKPGMFDWIGGSHNLWHAAVIGGIWFHWTALQGMFQDAFERRNGLMA